MAAGVARVGWGLGLLGLDGCCLGRMAGGLMGLVGGSSRVAGGLVGSFGGWAARVESRLGSNAKDDGCFSNNHMAEQEVIKHVKHAVDVARSKRPWTHKLQEILLEIGIIVFAVSLSIWLHNWSESRKDREEERDFLAGLKQDLQADMVEERSDKANYANVLRGMAYFQRVGSGEPINTDSLKKYQPILFSSIQIDPRVARFEALRGSGKLGIIRDKELLVNIADLYTKDFVHLRRVNDFLSALRTDRLLPFFAAHMQVNAPGTAATNLDKVFRLSESRVLLSALASAAGAIADYDSVIAKSNLIIQEINSDLK